MRVTRGVIMIIKGVIYLATMDGLKKMTGIVHDGDLVTIQIKENKIGLLSRTHTSSLEPNNNITGRD